MQGEKCHSRDAKEVGRLRNVNEPIMRKKKEAGLRFSLLATYVRNAISLNRLLSSSSISVASSKILPRLCIVRLNDPLRPTPTEFLSRAETPELALESELFADE